MFPRMVKASQSCPLETESDCFMIEWKNMEYLTPNTILCSCHICLWVSSCWKLCSSVTICKCYWSIYMWAKYATVLHVTVSTQGVYPLLLGPLKKFEGINKEYTDFFRHCYTTALNPLNSEFIWDWRHHNQKTLNVGSTVTGLSVHFLLNWKVIVKWCEPIKTGSNLDVLRIVSLKLLLK